MRVKFDLCPLCGSADFKQVLTADCSKHPTYSPALPPTITWCHCNACRHVFTDGYFADHEATAVFSKAQQIQVLGNDFERQRYVSAEIVSRVSRYARIADWLDVGFGNGSLVFTASEWGYRAVGIDLRADNVTALKSLGFEAHCSDLVSLDHDGRYSVLSMADVLEHMPYPKEGLAAADRLLGPDGVLFVSMPNSESTVWQLLDRARQNPYWGEIEHFHNFSRSRLYALLDEFDFAPREYHVSRRYRACMEVIATRK